jgi:hypothetical protein
MPSPNGLQLYREVKMKGREIVRRGIKLRHQLPLLREERKGLGKRVHSDLLRRATMRRF